MVIELYLKEATMTKLTKKQESLLNELLEGFDGDAEELLGKNGLLMQVKKRAVEAMPGRRTHRSSRL
jgi:hypothetical protein